MKPLIKQTVKFHQDVPWLEPIKVETISDGYFFTPEQMEEFIGEVFDKGNAWGFANGSDILEYTNNISKQELIKQLL